MACALGRYSYSLRQLQARQALLELLGELSSRRIAQRATISRHLPILVKISPDLDDPSLEDALDVIQQTGMDGVIATNTSITRDGLANLSNHDSRIMQEEGGLSGSPLCDISTTMIRKIVKYTDGKLPVIGVGGIMSPADAQAKFDAGACLVQVYTGLVYSGPGLVKKIVENIKI